MVKENEKAYYQRLCSFYLCNACSVLITYQIQKRQSSGSMDDRPLMWVRDYVESLHQNSRATLLFGKNNVLVQPVRARVCVCVCEFIVFLFRLVYSQRNWLHFLIDLRVTDLNSSALRNIDILSHSVCARREMTWRPSRAISLFIKRQIS